MGGFGDDAPTGIGGHIEDVFGHIFVLIFFEAVTFIDQLLVFHVETIGNVFQEDEAEHHVFILCRVDGATQQVGSFPYLVFKAYVGCIAFCHT